MRAKQEENLQDLRDSFPFNQSETKGNWIEKTGKNVWREVKFQVDSVEVGKQTHFDIPWVLTFETRGPKERRLHGLTKLIASRNPLPIDLACVINQLFVKQKKKSNETLHHPQDERMTPAEPEEKQSLA
jgi:hypothetical protein